MKLHDNTCFQWEGVVLGPYNEFLKSQGLIELLGSEIGCADLQKNVTGDTAHPRLDKGPPDSLPSMLWRDGKIENLRFTRRKCTGDQKSHHATRRRSDLQIVLQIVAWEPLSSLRAGALNS